MKALVLYEPWASLIAIGVKRNETRSRPWAYVGDVAICAAKQKLGEAVPESYEAALMQLWSHRSQFRGYASNVRDLYYSLPFGNIVCVVRKTGCVSTDDDNGDDRSLTPIELACGNYDAGRFYYPTENCRRIEPVPVIGRQGPFDLPPETLALVEKELARLRASA